MEFGGVVAVVLFKDVEHITESISLERALSSSGLFQKTTPLKGSLIMWITDN